MITDAELAATLRPAAWGLDGTVERLGGGMNSATALVTTPVASYVAKWVPADGHDALVRGAALAERLAETGLVTGRPLRTMTGDLAMELEGGWCSLGAFVPGQALTGETGGDQRDMARVLAAVHDATRVEEPTRFFSWLQADRPTLDVEPWVRPAVADALAAYAELPPLTQSWLHTDPAPEAFRRDGATVGLIDWTGAEPGPVLYDVASAVMYLGGPGPARPFLDTYAETGVLTAGELAHVEVLLRFRWAVQAAYFADRTAAGDVTGGDAAGNSRGLADARRGLGA